MYDKGKLMVSYGECRKNLMIDKKPIKYRIKGADVEEKRLICFGLRYIIENYINQPITPEIIHDMKLFYANHGFLNSPYPIEDKILQNLVGKLPPIRIYGLPEGTVMLPNTPVYIVEAEGDFCPFVTYYESILTQVWYPISVATLSRCCKEIFKIKYEEVGIAGKTFATDYPPTGKEGDLNIIGECTFLNWSLHDFGFRGASSIETNTIGGMAHLLNFNGSDTLSACYYAQVKYNNGEPVGESIAASEHSVMTSYKREVEAMFEILKKFGDSGAPVAIVMDSYDYEYSLTKVFPAAVKMYINDRKKKNLINTNYVEHDLTKNSIDISIFRETPILKHDDMKYLPATFAVTFRPDSGDPVQAVIQSLVAGVRLFGIAGIEERNSPDLLLTSSCSYEYNNITYIKPRFIRTIQGDGISVFTIQEMLNCITNPVLLNSNAKTSNWAFAPYSLLCGMGGGLLQKVNRDTPNFATKLCYVKYEDNSEKIVMKAPRTDVTKYSLPGLFKVNNVISDDKKVKIPIVYKQKQAQSGGKHRKHKGGEEAKRDYGTAMKLYYDAADPSKSPGRNSTPPTYGYLSGNFKDLTFNKLREDVENNWKLSSSENLEKLVNNGTLVNSKSAKSKEIIDLQEEILQQIHPGIQHIGDTYKFANTNVFDKTGAQQIVEVVATNADGKRVVKEEYVEKGLDIEFLEKLEKNELLATNNILYKNGDFNKDGRIENPNLQDGGKRKSSKSRPKSHSHSRSKH